jgi:hypothetical protein
MVKCPFCQFDNEEGALFCEQCKSDLGAPAEPVMPPMAEPLVAAAMAEPITEPVMPPPIEAVPEFQETAPLAFAEPAAVVETAPTDVPGSGATVPMEAPAVTEPIAQPAALASGSPNLSPSAVAAPPGGGPAAAFAADAKPRLSVIRGVKIGVEYPIYEGENFIGRADEKPVDIDLEDQEPPDRIWSSRQHACIIFQNGEMTIEDLNSSNGTFVNRTRVYPGQKRQLGVNDVVQIGTVQMKVKA